MAHYSIVLDFMKLNCTHQEEAGGRDGSLSAANSHSNGPLNPQRTRKKHTESSRMPQAAPIKAVTQCHICNDSQTARNCVFRRPSTRLLQANGAPTPQRSAASRRCTSHRLKDAFTAASANRGGDERRPHAGATCPVSPHARVKGKASHAAFPHLHICVEKCA